MTDAAADRDGQALTLLAKEKLTRVLGAAQGTRMFNETLAAAGLSEIATADDLYHFGSSLSKRGGFEAAVGGLLTVAAVLRGASGEAR